MSLSRSVLPSQLTYSDTRLSPWRSTTSWGRYCVVSVTTATPDIAPEPIFRTDGARRAAPLQDPDEPPLRVRAGGAGAGTARDRGRGASGPVAARRARGGRGADRAGGRAGPGDRRRGDLRLAADRGAPALARR